MQRYHEIEIATLIERLGWIQIVARVAIGLRFGYRPWPAERVRGRIPGMCEEIPLSEQQLARLNEFMRRCPYHRWLGCLITTHDPSGELEVVLPFREEMQSGDADETAHGGLVATLIDIAAHAALHARTGFGVRTISLQVNYLRPAMTPLAARARPLLIGKTVGYVDVEVFDRRRERAGLGRAVFSTRSPAQAERQ